MSKNLEGSEKYTEDEMQVKFWGVRGSFPQTLSSVEWSNHFKKMMNRFFDSGYSRPNEIDLFFSQQGPASLGGYGSATTCVEVLENGKNIIIDGGSGLKKLSDQFDSSSKTEHHILLTHFHYDHIMGIPFFSPHFLKEQHIHYYFVQSEGEKIIRELFRKPLFPVEFSRLSAQITFHPLAPYEKVNINGFDVIPYRTDHPDPCFGFKVKSPEGKTYSHAVDNEAQRLTVNELAEDAGLFEHTHFLYIDAPYTEDEMSHKKGWGHGTFERALKICENFKIQNVLLGHHEPSMNTDGIIQLSLKTAQFIEKNPQLKKIKWSFAYEGQIIEV